MSTSPNKTRIGKAKKATARDHERFIERHRQVLLHYLDGTAQGRAAVPDALEFVENVLAEWQESFSGCDLAAPSPEERTFWFSLYQLEELVENTGPYVDPYEEFLMMNLIEVGELLRQRRALPEHRFMATRPDGS